MKVKTESARSLLLINKDRQGYRLKQLTLLKSLVDARIGSLVRAANILIVGNSAAIALSATVFFKNTSDLDNKSALLAVILFAIGLVFGGLFYGGTTISSDRLGSELARLTLTNENVG